MTQQSLPVASMEIIIYHAQNFYLIESSVLYIPMATPAPTKSLTVCTMLVEPSAAVHLISNWPAPGMRKSVALYCQAN